MNGGYRGMIALVPALPTGPDKKHLDWTIAAFDDFASFFAALAPHATTPLAYRSTGIELRFMRSPKARTPSAYAQGWVVAYNLAGSLHTSAAAVRETLFHEVFHLNDAAHGDWSIKTLGKSYDAIVNKCGANTACLSRFAPNDTMVRGGTYYAFQPGNDVREYAAELSVRYLKEQRARLDGKTVTAPFKCGAEANGAAWSAFVAEFMGGADLVPACK
jgi:hypothetical protein